MVKDQSLKLIKRGEKAQNMPIDVFLSSLAQTHKSRAMGIILSGTGHDGTIGLKEIRQYGGITFTEDPQSAGYDGMPQSAIDQGIVDFVMTPENIAEKLLQINAINQSSQLWEGEKLLKGREDDHYRRIFSIICLHSGVDFNHCKQSTLQRRIAKRMAINQTNSLGDYLKYLNDQSDEQESLFQDMLIPVTYFFREPKTFETLVQSVFPDLLEKKSKTNQPIRLWVAG